MMTDESLHGSWVEIGGVDVDSRELELLLGTPITAIIPLDGGSVNRVARIELEDGTSLILRIAPSNIEADFSPSWITPSKLDHEQNAIARLSKLKPIARLLPKTILYKASWESDIGDMVIQTLVEGQSAASALPSMTDAQRIDFYRQLGVLTRRIHSVRSNRFGPSWDGEWFGTWSELVLSDCEGFLEDAYSMTLRETPFKSLIKQVKANREELDAVRGSLIHSDLSLEHVFVEAKGKRWIISGVIDLEFARVADPVSEGLLLQMLQHSDDESSAFFEGYGRDFEASDVRIDIANRLQAAWNITDKARPAG